MSTEFYDRPMVIRLKKIFDDPQPPRVITQQQFDYDQEALVRAAAKPWHGIDDDDYRLYLMDMSYVDLQQDLFDYLFPAFLIQWWEDQLGRFLGPSGECDLYRAIDRGQVFALMMDEPRRQDVYEWITDAYIDGVDAWSSQLSVVYQRAGPDNLHGPLWSFNALGQSVPVTRAILEQLCKVTTLGRAQWWLVFASGIIWNENTCPAVPPWTRIDGGGGIYVTSASTMIYEHGYLPQNLEAVTNTLSYSMLMNLMQTSLEVLRDSTYRDWAQLAWEELYTYPSRIEARLARFFQLLALPELGGLLHHPLDGID